MFAVVLRRLAEDHPSMKNFAPCAKFLRSIALPITRAPQRKILPPGLLYNQAAFFLISLYRSLLAETCLTYLNSLQVKNLTPYSPLDYGSMPFFRYAARYWGTHTNKDLTNNAKTLALRLLNQSSFKLSFFQLLYVFNYSLFSIVNLLAIDG